MKGLLTGQTQVDEWREVVAIVAASRQCVGAAPVLREGVHVQIVDQDLEMDAKILKMKDGKMGEMKVTKQGEEKIKGPEVRMKKWIGRRRVHKKMRQESEEKAGKIWR